MANDVKLGDYKPLDANLKPVKVDEVVSALELSSVGNGARVTGGLEVTADLLGSNAKPINGNPIITNYLTVPIATTIGLNIKGSFGTDTTEGEGINFLQSDKTIALFSGHHNSTFFYIYGNIGATTDNYLHIKVEDDGVSTIVTNDSDGEVGHLVLQPDGDLNLYPKTGTVKIADIDATSDFFQVAVSSAGATTLSTVDSSAASAHLKIVADGHVEFDGCGVGFDRLEATFGTAAVTSAGGNSTDIDFRLGNKYILELTGNITSGSSEYLSFIFPAVSGNFLLVIGQDGTGSRAIGSSAAWRAYASDGSAADNTLFADGTDGAVRWKGGSAPTLTTTADKADIISIYWDADSQTALCDGGVNF